jgi:hypothetical protein
MQKGNNHAIIQHSAGPASYTFFEGGSNGSSQQPLYTSFSVHMAIPQWITS